MSVARILSRAQLGLEAPLVQVEVHLGRGLPCFTIVGLPAPVVRESRERVRAALQNSGYEFPSRPHHRQSGASRAVSKQGGSFDLPIAPRAAASRADSWGVAQASHSSATGSSAWLGRA